VSTNRSMLLPALSSSLLLSVYTCCLELNTHLFFFCYQIMKWCSSLTRALDWSSKMHLVQPIKYVVFLALDFRASSSTIIYLFWIFPHFSLGIEILDI
jgi:hypothetical protein